MTVATLSVDQSDLVYRFVDGVKAYISEETDPVYTIDYIDVLEDGLQDENISYTEEQKAVMLDKIERLLEKVYGCENVYFGGTEQAIPVEGQFRTYHGQMAIKITEFSKFHYGNSTIFEFEGKEYRTIQDPYISDDGTAYKAHALDEQDNEYLVEWEVVNPNHEDAQDACLWDKPVKVEKA